jgi:hypothetical protein
MSWRTRSVTPVWSTRWDVGGRAEVEAESVAFIVCRAAGLMTAAYSFGYVAGWSGGDPKVVKATAERVVTAVRDILDRAGLLDPTAHQQAEAA